MDEAYDGNQREFIMSMLLRSGQSVIRKWRESKNAMDFFRYISGKCQMIEMYKVNGIIYFLNFQSKIVYLLYIP